MEDKKLYCLHVFNSWMFPNLCLYSPYKAIKDFRLDEKFIREELRNNPIMIIGANVDEYGVDIDKSDDEVEMDYFFFSYDLKFIKNQAKKEIEYRIPVLENSMKALKEIDVENLLDISKEQEDE